MKNIFIDKLKQQYDLVGKDMGEFKTIKKGLYRFDCEAYEIENVGNLFFITMKAMFGLMKMETTVLTPLHKDLSFSNFDIVNAAGNDTYLFEMYRSSIKETDLSAFESIREKYQDLSDYETSPRWYDEFKLGPSMAKKGKKISERADRMFEDLFDQYLIYLREAAECDPELKAAEVRKYVDRLIEEGGVAVDGMNKIIGKEKTAELIRRFMYGL